LPRISYFYGIAIYMYYRDHAPPHFHAIYGSEEIEMGIRSRRVLRGALPARALSLVRQWGKLHEVELLDAWELARRRAPLRPIPPLE
jgi:hypothetical protein